MERPCRLDCGPRSWITVFNLTHPHPRIRILSGLLLDIAVITLWLIFRPYLQTHHSAGAYCGRARGAQSLLARWCRSELQWASSGHPLRIRMALGRRWSNVLCLWSATPPKQLLWVGGYGRVCICVCACMRDPAAAPIWGPILHPLLPATTHKHTHTW